MGTNYYLYEKEDCSCCGRSFEPLHIGKSSGGWCFSVHVIPEDHINTLEDWKLLWNKQGTHIKNEYGERISVFEMEVIITNRSWHGEFPERHPVDGKHCVGNGEGTWDYINGEFS